MFFISMVHIVVYFIIGKTLNLSVYTGASTTVSVTYNLKMPKEKLKDKVEGNELDISLTELQVIPVKELAALPKVTRLDMSCNLLKTIPDEFCNLTQLVKLDLSKNSLTELPASFGQLVRLQHLDLFANQLEVLPLGMSQLKQLKWLDLKDNPLHVTFRAAVGDCLNETQCRKSAKNVLELLQKLEYKEECRKRQLQQEKEAKAAAFEAQQEQLHRQKKEQKLKEKEIRRRKHEAERAKQQAAEASHEENRQAKPINHGVRESSSKANQAFKAPRRTTVCCTSLLLALIFTVVLLTALYISCTKYSVEYEACTEFTNMIHRRHAQISTKIDLFIATIEKYFS